MSTVFSAIALCNRAFDAIEHRPFGDWGDGSEEAEFAARHWDAARRHVLAAVPWRFAEAFARAEAAIEAVTPAATPYAVALTPDCLSFRQIDVAGDYTATPYGDRLLRTDVAPPFVYAYTADVAEPFRFSPGMVEALVDYLAHLFAPRFTRSQNRATILLQRHVEKLDQAAQTEARAGTVADHRLGGIRGSWTSAMGAQP